MNAGHVIFGLLFVVMGLTGGMTAISRWVRGYTGFKILELPWGGIYGFGLVFSGIILGGAIRKLDSAFGLLLLAAAPFAAIGSVMWGFAFVMELAFRASGSRNMRLDPTYDVGDGLMVRRQFRDAEAAYRKSLAADPLDTGALLRIARAQVSDGRVEDAVRELEIARRHAIERTDGSVSPSPALQAKLQEKDFRQDRILRLSFMLGDLFVEKLNDNTRAKKLYEESLEILFGYAPADPLRDRIKALSAPDRLTLEEAVEQAQPRKISL